MLRTLWVRLVSLALGFIERVFYYPKLRNVYRSLAQIDFVIDVGANKGQTIDFFAGLNPNIEILAFEASPSTYSKLAAKKVSNNVEIVNLGVSEVDGQLRFYDCVLNETSTFELPDMDSKYLKKKAKFLMCDAIELFNESFVHVVSLDNFLSRRKFEKQIDVLKIDVEGHELKVLLGSRKVLSSGSVRYVQIEQHEDDMRVNDFAEITSYLADFDYVPIRSIPHSFGNFKEVIFAKRS
jgi:FkbM family methyltransferase